MPPVAALRRPYGGSNALGLMGYVAAMREAAAQVESPDWFGAHVFATSSGGTQGMLLAHLAGIPDPFGCWASAWISPPPHSPRASLPWPLMAHGCSAWTGRRPPSDSWTMATAGRATPSSPGGSAEAIRLLARLEGILVDPVYTGRALAGLLDQVGVARSPASSVCCSGTRAARRR